jgi:hypothetical protein
MTLDDMQVLWQQHDAKLDELRLANALTARKASLDRARTTLGRVTLHLRLEMLADAVAVVFLGGFAADHVRQPDLLAAAVALDICALAILVGGIASLGMLAVLDYDRPAIEIARTLDRLRLIRVRFTMWTLFVAPLMWPPLLIVGMSALFGIDVWNVFGPGWVLANFVPGAVVLALGIMFARRYDSRRGPAAQLHPLVAALSGRSLRDATGQIAELRRYEADAE